MSCVPGGGTGVSGQDWPPNRGRNPPNQGRNPPGRGHTDDGHHVRQHVAPGHAIQSSLWSTGTPVSPPKPRGGDAAPPSTGVGGSGQLSAEKGSSRGTRGHVASWDTLGGGPGTPACHGGGQLCPPSPKPPLAAPTRCANPGALILQRYGRLLPSDTRYTPNSPCGDMGTGLVTQGHPTPKEKSGTRTGALRCPQSIAGDTCDRHTTTSRTLGASMAV